MCAILPGSRRAGSAIEPVSLALSLNLAVEGNTKWYEIRYQHWHAPGWRETQLHNLLTVVDQCQQRTDNQGSFEGTLQGIALGTVQKQASERHRLSFLCLQVGFVNKIKCLRLTEQVRG
jgi:hypothetical protein